MSAEESKPVVAETTAAPAIPETPATTTTESPAVESTSEPAPAADAAAAAAPVEPEPVKSDEAPAAESSEPAAAETNADASEAASPEAPAESQPVTPITSGFLKFKAPGLKLDHFVPPRKFFYLGEAPVPTQKLTGYLRGEKPEISHSTAAWSSQTGLGLLYCCKKEADKEVPEHVFNLAEVGDIQTVGIDEIVFRLGGQKYVLLAKTAVEREGWVLGIKAAQEEALAKKEEITGSEEYKAVLAELAKPVVPTAAVAAKKSTDIPAAEQAAVATEEAPVTEESTKAKKARSASRGKRASVFGFFNKKDEEAKEATPALPTEEGTTAEAAPAEAAEAAETETPAATEEKKLEGEEAAPATTTDAAPAEAEAEASAMPTQPTHKPKRGSVFGFLEKGMKIRSPTHEKKESEALAPIAKSSPETEPAAAAAPEGTTTEVTGAAPATPTESNEPVTAVSSGGEEPVKSGASSPKEGFLSKLRHKSEKAKPSTSEGAAPVVAEPISDEAPAAEGEATSPAPASPGSPTERRRSSFFDGFKKMRKEKSPAPAAKDEAAPPSSSESAGEPGPIEESGDKTTEETAPAESGVMGAVMKEEKKVKSGLSGIGRRFSKMIKSTEEKISKPAKSEKAEKKSEEIKEEAAPAEEPVAESSVPAEAPQIAEPSAESSGPAIGDVTADSVSVGKNVTPAVQATA